MTKTASICQNLHTFQVVDNILGMGMGITRKYVVIEREETGIWRKLQKNTSPNLGWKHGESVKIDLCSCSSHSNHV